MNRARDPQRQAPKEGEPGRTAASPPPVAVPVRPPPGLTAGLVASLARTHGNAAVARAVGARTLARMPVEQARKAVDDAASGPGTDEEAIYRAIRDCDDRAKLAPLIRPIIEDEMSGFDLWRAELLLALGPEASWPAGLTEVFAATDQAGTDEARIFTALNKLDAGQAATLGKAPGLMRVLEDELSGFDLKRVQLLLKYGGESYWAAGLKEVLEACDGPGTDEARIFRALNGLDEAKARALAAIPGVVDMLEDELSGIDLLRAKLYLKYGGEAGWPKGLKEVLEASDQAGTDEGRIYRALSALSEAEAQSLAAAPGIMALLEDELSGHELQAAKDYLSGAYARTIAAHKANVAALTALVTTWRASGTLTPLQANTLDFVFPPSGAPRVKLHVTTSTHDAEARAKHHGKKDSRAYFGTDQVYPDDSGTYDADVTSERNIEYDSAGVVAAQGGSAIWLYDVTSHTAKAMLGNIVHELQHFADRSEDQPDWKQPYKSPEQSWERYKTEFRAWWIDGDMDGYSDTKGSAAAPFDNERQKAIFDHFMSGNSYTEWLKPNYDDNKDVHGQKFQDLVHGYTHPDGINLVNSPRIDDFYGALKRTGLSDDDPAKSPLADVLAAAGTLNADDLAFVNSARAKPLQEMMRDHLSKSAFVVVTAKLGSPAWAAVNIAPARRAILAAGKGPGTNEQAIYDAIAGATDAERAEMAKDRVIIAEIEDEMSGMDLWRARQYLKYGPKAKWPKAVAAQDK